MTDMETPVPEIDSRDARARKVGLAHMESDLVYFQARLEIIGDPETANQSAQHKAFSLLQRTYGNLIVRAKRQAAG